MGHPSFGGLIVGQNFVVCDRDQVLLMPPSLRDWLGSGELVWCVLDVVAEMDLACIYGDYRADGHGRAAFDPGMMVALLLYAYAVGERSSRGIERRCCVDVAFRVITANEVPDHATIARFRVRHQEALAGLFGQVLGLCARSGLVSLGVIALDGTKIAANASGTASRTYEQIVVELLAEAEAADEAEDELFGEARGDELPREMAEQVSRRARLRKPSASWRPSIKPPKTLIWSALSNAPNGKPSITANSAAPNPKGPGIASRRGGGSTSPISTRGRSRHRKASSRAITPKPSRLPTRSSSPRRSWAMAPTTGCWSP